MAITRFILGGVVTGLILNLDYSFVAWRYLVNGVRLDDSVGTGSTLAVLALRHLVGFAALWVLLSSSTVLDSTVLGFAIATLVCAVFFLVIPLEVWYPLPSDAMFYIVILLKVAIGLLCGWLVARKTPVGNRRLTTA